MTAPVLGFLQSALAAGDVYAVVSQLASGEVTIAVDVGPGPGETVVAPLEGNEGPAGTSQFPLRLQLDVLDDPELLPTDLTNTDADIGKYWLIDQMDGDVVISSAAYIWFGSEFRVLPFGTAGIKGPYGVLVPYASLIGPDETSQISVPGDGTATSPYLMTFELSVPEGPPGPSAALATFSDVDIEVPPTVGQFLGYNGQQAGGHAIWEPMSVGDIIPMPYVIPQSAFSSYANITFAKTVTVATFAVPPNSFAWKPLVWGQIEMAYNFELSLSPLVGIEVLLGSPNPAVGTLVARGFGNSPGGVVTIIPHTSTPATPTVAMTPSNATALVGANHTGAAGTLYVNLVNDGLFAIFDFQASTGAQLFVLACPAVQLTPTPICGSITTKVRLSAKTITLGS